jgi:hypothetical protein
MAGDRGQSFSKVYKAALPLARRLLLILITLYFTISLLPSSTMAPSLSTTSNEPIPDYIWALPLHLEPQPALVQPWCTNCLASFTKDGKSASQAATCSRVNVYSVCAPCASGKKGNCVAVCFPRSFRSITIWLMIDL